MTNATHTPGPWRRQVIAPTFEHTSIQTDDGKLAIARVYGRGANARLIAAAPDLLAALEQCLPIIDAHRRAALGEGDIAAMNARAAIAKAKGANDHE